MSQNRQTNLQDLKIQELLGAFLLLRTSGDASAPQSQHLDEDSFAAFIEGNIGEREAEPLVSHLVDCSFCRNVTAELIKLDYASAAEKIHIDETSIVPSKVSEVLSSLLSRIFGAGDAIVFAHQESEEETEKTKNQKDDTK